MLEPDGFDDAQVLLPAGAEFRGVVALAGPARIAGVLRGEVSGPGPLWIEPGAHVEAQVETDEVHIAGEVVGDVHASRRVELAGTARIRGVLRSPSLVLAEGALLEGRCEVGAAAEEQAVSEPARAAASS
jgi:cytoskeletal protein CcmA (bactofilin family)